MTTINKNKTTRGRGRGKTPNRRYSLLARYPDRPSERSIVQVCGREQDTLEERHRNLLEMERYCYTHDLLYRWFLAAPFQEEAGAQVYILYLTIEHTPKAWNNVRSQVSRLGLTSKRVPMLPIVGETVAPEVQEQEQEQEREEVQV